MPSDELVEYQIASPELINQYRQILTGAVLPAQFFSGLMTYRGSYDNLVLFSRLFNLTPQKTNINQKKAIEVATQTIIGSRNSIERYVKASKLPPFFTDLLSNLKLVSAEPIRSNPDQIFPDHWELIYEKNADAANLNYTDAKSLKGKVKRLKGRYDDTYLRIDVSGIGIVTAFILKTPVLQGFQKKKIEVDSPENAESGFTFFRWDDYFRPAWLGTTAGLYSTLNNYTHSKDESQRVFSDLFLGNSERRFTPFSPTIHSISDTLSIIFRVREEGVRFFSDNPEIDITLISPVDTLEIVILKKGDFLEFIEIISDSFVYVQRLEDKKKGYVAWRFLDIDNIIGHYIENPPFPDLPEAIISRIAKLLMSQIHEAVARLTKIEFVAKYLIPILISPYPPLVPPPHPVGRKFIYVPVEFILECLRRLDIFYPTETLALILIKMREENYYFDFITSIRDEHLTKYYSVILQICFILPPSQLFLLLNKVIPDFFKVALGGLIEKNNRQLGKNIRQMRLKKKPEDGISDILFPILKDEVAKLIKKAPIVAEEVFRFLDSLFRIKLTEFRYYLKTGKSKEIRRSVLDMDLMVDACFECLFSESVSNPLITDSLLVYLWKQIKSQTHIPLMYLIKEGDMEFSTEKGEDWELYEIFCPKTNEFLTPIPTPKKTTIGILEEKGRSESLDECNKILTTESPVVVTKGSPATSAGIQSLAIEFMKRMISECAGKVQAFLYEDVYALYMEFPELLPDFNKVIDGSIRTAAANSLTIPPIHRSKFIPRVGDFSSEKLNATPDIINNLSWADIVKIWFYELGSEERFNPDFPLIFSGLSKSTREIVSHPMWKKLETYSTARYHEGHFESFTILVHYDVKTFFKAAISNDVILNFLGSFNVEVVPSVSDSIIKYTISNDLTMESVSRFQEDYSVISPIDNKKGIIKSKLRKTPNSIHIGGSIRCKWEWIQHI